MGINYSECELIDSPFGFVKGCTNFGINWNAFMAPTGSVLFIALPFSIIYFIGRALRLVASLLRYLVRKIKRS
uniref:hypothetical protein n=1 Tax=Thaumasiovibrio occultus TaxID=1891184 RepID=UPI000B351CE1|nr:hypothetical protein [Thaumasiovibrio occultus]